MGLYFYNNDIDVKFEQPVITPYENSASSSCSSRLKIRHHRELAHSGLKQQILTRSYLSKKFTVSEKNKLLDIFYSFNLDEAKGFKCC